MNPQPKLSIYQVLPRLFDNRNESPIPHGTLKENGSGKIDAFTPKALEAIRDLGITHIWYTGLLEHATQSSFRGIPADPSAIVKGQAGSPYAIKDYYDLSPTLASRITQRATEVEQLFDRTHSAGLGVIIDFVPNHVARTYHSDAAPEGVSDFGSQDHPDTFLPSNNFYYLSESSLSFSRGGSTYTESPARATGNDCFHTHVSEHDWYETVKLNYGIDPYTGSRHFFPIPDTWHKMYEILRYWSSKGVDGFRCDMAEMVPPEFWSWCISRLRNDHPSLLFIAEVYQPHLYPAYIEAGFDYLYDKVGLYDTLIGVLRGHTPSHAITGVHLSQEHLKGHLLRFMENHDEQRLASDFICGSGLRAFPAMVVSTLLGPTEGIMTYFGQELGERGMDAEGFSGLDGRTSIFDYWSIASLRRWIGRSTYNGKLSTPDEVTLRTLYQKLLQANLSEPALVSGGVFDLMYANHKEGIDHSTDYFFLRSTGSQTMLIAVNFSDHEHTYDITLPAHAFEVLGIPHGSSYSVTDLLSLRRGLATLTPDQPVRVTVAAHGAILYRFDQ